MKIPICVFALCLAIAGEVHILHLLQLMLMYPWENRQTSKSNCSHITITQGLLSYNSRKGGECSFCFLLRSLWPMNNANNVGAKSLPFNTRERCAGFLCVCLTCEPITHHNQHLTVIFIANYQEIRAFLNKVWSEPGVTDTAEVRFFLIWTWTELQRLHF